MMCRWCHGIPDPEEARKGSGSRLWSTWSFPGFLGDLGFSAKLGYMCLFQFWFIQGICLGVGLLGHMVVLLLVFKEISISSFIVAVINLHSHKTHLMFLFYVKGQKLKHIIRSDQISHSVVSNSLRPRESQHARPPCPSPSPGVHSDSLHRVSDAIWPSHPLSSPSPPAPNPSQHQSLFQ